MSRMTPAWVVPGARRLRMATAPLWLLVLVLSASASAAAPPPQAEPSTTTLLHTLFQDHAVLQRDAPIRVWGTAAGGEALTIALAGKTARARADGDGRWQVLLPALPAGGPHSLTVTGSSGAAQRVQDVLIGDVWLCSGQSNMVLQVHRTLDSRAEIAGSANDSIRMLTVGETGSVTPLQSFATPVRWKKAAPENAGEFSAACFYFARELQKQVPVPMGLISAAWGGSRIQAWTSAPALRASGLYNDELDVLQRYAEDPAAAVADWGQLWGRWWSARADATAGDEPWRVDYTPGPQWRRAPQALGAWENWGLPELAGFDGMVWYRTHVQLSAEQAAQEAVLVLGPVDEVDMTWVNGRAVGSSYGAGDAREYRLPSGLLRAGDNTIVINVLDTYREGGLSGPASAHYLRLADGSRVALEGEWNYRIVPGHDSPPRAPWQTAAGLSTLYNGMIAPIGAYGLRGMLWYQGESNTGEAARYAPLLRLLRQDWRNRFGAKLPMLIVQLAGYGMPAPHPSESGWAELREAQRQVAAEDPASGLAVAIDIGDRYDIHPPNKQELGRRLARSARKLVYGEALPASGPVLHAATREGEAVVVVFTDVTGDLVAYGAHQPLGFELCGADRESCEYADARIEGNRVLLRGPSAANATRVRFCWADSPVCTLYDAAGLPAMPFETPVQ